MYHPCWAGVEVGGVPRWVPRSVVCVDRSTRLVRVSSPLPRRSWRDLRVCWRCRDPGPGWGERSLIRDVRGLRQITWNGDEEMRGPRRFQEALGRVYVRWRKGEVVMEEVGVKGG